MREVFATEKETKPQRSGAQLPEISVTVHYAANGPGLESCMISILNAHLSGRTHL